MNREANIARFEAELDKVQRPGMGLLLEYIRRSDFYTAPASTHYHLSCEGGLLQHSLNVLDALRGLLMKEPDGKDEAGNPKVKYHYVVADKFVATFPQDSVIITALLHDICKTFSTPPAPGTPKTRRPASGKRCHTTRSRTRCPSDTAQRAP